MSEREAPTRFAVTLRFHGDLAYFLKRSDSHGQVVQLLGEKTSVKDVIEACGVPHPEVDLIVCGGVPRGFGFHVTEESSVDVYAIASAPDLHPAERLQRRHLTRFVVDGHLGKLARDLRLLGFDTTYRRDAEDVDLVRVAVAEERALLTRDRRLLMHSVISDGYCPRSQLPAEQLVDVVRRFELLPAIRPFTRCLRCNGILERAQKEAVLADLEPLTKIYYVDFRRCAECSHVYWAGSHFDKLQARIDAMRAKARLQSEQPEKSGPDWARTSDPALIKRML